MMCQTLGVCVCLFADFAWKMLQFWVDSISQLMLECLVEAVCLRVLKSTHTLNVLFNFVRFMAKNSFQKESDEDRQRTHTHAGKNGSERKKGRTLQKKFVIDVYLHFWFLVRMSVPFVRSFVGVWRGWQNPLMNLLCLAWLDLVWFGFGARKLTKCPANTSLTTRAVNASTAIRLHW